MKKKIMIIASLTCLISITSMITGFAFGSTTKPNIIGFTSMAESIEKHYDGTVLELDLTLRNDKPVYKASIVINEERVVVYFDAITGVETERRESVSLDEEEIKIFSAYNVSPTVIEAIEPAQVVSQIAAQTQTGYSANTQITHEEAKEIALAEVGGGTVREIELDYEKGILVYEIEVKYNGVEYDLDIDAATGEIVKHMSDYLVNSNKNSTVPVTTEKPSAQTSVQSATTQISYEKAKEIALAKVGGGTVKEIELDYEKGLQVYELEIKYNGLEYDLKIDVATGEIVKYEIDR